MQYITFMHNNVKSQPSDKDWQHFFEIANQSGLFRGGSAIGKRTTIGKDGVPDITSHIGGYMRFDAESLDELIELLNQHPVPLMKAVKVTY